MEPDQTVSYFKWQIAIFDDVPSQYDKSSIEKYFDIVWVDRLSKIPTKLTALRNSHLAIIDMNWERGDCLTFGSGDEGRAFVPTPAEMRNMALPDIARKWACAISAWALYLDFEDAREDRFPTARIDRREIGAWIGALLSWIAPKTIPIFLTGYKTHFKKGIQAPLSLFSSSPFIVNYKSTSSTTATEKIEGGEFWLALREKQIQLLRNLEVRNWFFSKVLINGLCGNDYEPGVCSVYFEGSGSVEDAVMEFEHVFPNLCVSNQEEVIAEIRHYFEVAELSDSDYIAIDAVKHALSRKTRLGLNDFQEAYQHALSGGDWCDEIAKQLKQIILSKEKSNEAVGVQEKVEFFRKRALDLVDAVCVNCEKALQGLVFQREEWEVSLPETGARVVASQRDVGDRSAKQGLRLRRFPVQWLGDILFHLRNNADRWKCKWTGKACEVIRGKDSFFVFSFSSEWKGELGWKLFWEVARKSSEEKGEYRGLPLVIRRGIESGADALFIKTGQECRFVWADDGLDALKGDVLNKEWDFQFALIYRIEKLEK